MTARPRGRWAVFALVALVLLAAPPAVASPEGRLYATVLVESDETVRGDLYAAGGTVVVRGEVQGDLNVVAGDVLVLGDVAGDVNAVGGVVQVDGTVLGDVSAGAGSFSLGEAGLVGGHLAVTGATATVDGTVAEAVHAGADTISVGPSAAVGRDLVYEGTLRGDPASVVEGDVRHDRGLTLGLAPVVPRLPFVGEGVGMAVNLLAGLVLLAAFPRFADRISRGLGAGPVSAGLTGLGALAVGALAVLVFAVSLIALPLALVLAMALVTAVWLGGVYTGYALGDRLLGVFGGQSRVVALFLGTIVVGLFGLLPGVGWLVQVVAALVGLGALLRALAAEYVDRRATYARLE